MTSVILHRKGTALRSVGERSHRLPTRSPPRNPRPQQVPMYTFNTSVVHTDCFSLPSSPREVQKLYWLCLQEHLTLANLQDPCRLILGSTGNNRTQADAHPASIPGRGRTGFNRLELGQIKYALLSLLLSEMYKGPICKLSLIHNSEPTTLRRISVCGRW